MDLARRFAISLARLAASLTLAAWLVCAPGSASAGCLTPHLRFGESWPLGANHPDRLELLDLGESEPTDAPLPPIAPPCRGALCSGNPGVPGTPVRFSPWPPPDTALPPVVRIPLAPGSSARNSSESSPHLPDSALGLFRPPRASARP